MSIIYFATYINIISYTVLKYAQGCKRGGNEIIFNNHIKHARIMSVSIFCKYENYKKKFIKSTILIIHMQIHD